MLQLGIPELFMFIWMNVSRRQQCFTYQRKPQAEAIQTNTTTDSHLVHWDKPILSEKMLHTVMRPAAVTHGKSHHFSAPQRI